MALLTKNIYIVVFTTDREGHGEGEKFSSDEKVEGEEEGKDGRGRNVDGKRNGRKKARKGAKEYNEKKGIARKGAKECRRKRGMARERAGKGSERMSTKI